MPHHYTRLDQLDAQYTQIYLSPHFDDAALSCGGAIARASADGRPALVVTICSGSPDPASSFSPFAAEQHRKWSLPPAEAMLRRLHEDIEALEILGADSLQLDMLDAVYRLPTAYHDEQSLFGVVDPADPLSDGLRPVLTALLARCPEAILYAPLAVGHHVDHQLAHQVAAELAGSGASVAFYEELPYALTPGAVAQRLDELGGAALFLPVITAIDGEMTRKIEAVEAYASQLNVLFGGAAAMAAALRSYAAGLGVSSEHGERIWIRQ